MGPRPRLIPTSCTDVVSDTTDMDSDTTADTMADSDITARGLLMLRLSLILTTPPTVLDTPDTSDMPDSDTDTLDTDTADTTWANRFHQDLSVNHRLDIDKNGLLSV